MPVDPRDIQKSMNEDRYKCALPTRDNLVVPTFALNTRKQVEGDTRVREHMVAQFKDWFGRVKGRAATDGEVAEFLGDGGDAA